MWGGIWWWEYTKGTKTCIERQTYYRPTDVSLSSLSFSLQHYNRATIAGFYRDERRAWRTAGECGDQPYRDYCHRRRRCVLTRLFGLLL